MLKKLAAVLLVLVMLGSVTSPVVAAAPMTTGIPSKDLQVVAENSIKIYKNKTNVPYTFKIKSLWKPVNKSYAISN